MAESADNQNEEGAKEYTPLKDQTEEAPAKNLFLVRGHNFNLYTFKQPTFCSLCDKFVWGAFKQGYSCKECRMAVHRRCYANVVGKCLLAKEGGEDDNENQTEDEPAGKAHTLEVYTFKTPTFCNHCGSLLWGLCSQGLKCKECKFNVHHRCKERAVHVCGVNQKAEIMKLEEEETPDANENNEDNKKDGEKEEDKKDEERQTDDKNEEDASKPDENSDKPAEESEKAVNGDSSQPEASEKPEE